ncbi:hypothetical protein [Nonomuraea dietziae]|uniref:hypothetical protein n=1 Tax=Nonomuraea dietziae TaxID=65515 RepID=UPI0033DD3C79
MTVALAAALAALATGTLAHPAAAPINCVAKAKPEGATLYRLEAVDYGPEVDFERHMDYLFPARRLAGGTCIAGGNPPGNHLEGNWHWSGDYWYRAWLGVRKIFYKDGPPSNLYFDEADIIWQ